MILYKGAPHPKYHVFTTQGTKQPETSQVLRCFTATFSSVGPAQPVLATQASVSHLL